MKDKRNLLLLSYIKANVAPILVDFLTGDDISGAVILPADISKEELNGHYIGCDFMPPKWLSGMLMEKTSSILVIDNIDKISKEEQMKFIELLKYRKISTFELPRNTVIIVTAKEISKDKISEEIYSLVAQI